MLFMKTLIVTFINLYLDGLQPERLKPFYRVHIPGNPYVERFQPFILVTVQEPNIGKQCSQHLHKHATVQPLSKTCDSKTDPHFIDSVNCSLA